MTGSILKSMMVMRTSFQFIPYYISSTKPSDLCRCKDLLWHFVVRRGSTGLSIENTIIEMEMSLSSQENAVLCKAGWLVTQGYVNVGGGSVLFHDLARSIVGGSCYVS